MKFLSTLSKDSLICSELQIKDYKELLKCSYGDDPNKIIFIETLSEIFSNISKKPTEFFKNLNIVDLFCFLLDVRLNSQGEVCNVILTRNDTKMSLELKIAHLLQDIKTLNSHISVKISQSNISVLLECPSSARLLQPSTQSYLPFVKGVYIKHEDAEKYVEITTNEQAEQLIERLFPKTLMQINEWVINFFVTFTRTNFLSRYKIEDQNLSFVPSLDSLIWYTKLMFSEPLDVFYSNIFYLSHLGHIDASYVENSVVGEYNYFVNQLKGVLESKNSSDEPNNQNNFSEEAGLPEEFM